MSTSALTSTVPDNAPSNATDIFPNEANTFVLSVMSLCSKSIESGSEISEPVPCEHIFLNLLLYCGVVEAKRWAEVMALPHEHSYGLLARLWHGPNWLTVIQQSSKHDPLAPPKQNTRSAKHRKEWDAAIAQTKRKIADLEKALKVFEECKAAGESWPGEAARPSERKRKALK
jgi:hypothetical protein